MITEHSNGEKPKTYTPGFVERVGSSVLDIVHSGHEHRPVVAKVVGAGILAVATAGALEMAWLWTINTGAKQ